MFNNNIIENSQSKNYGGAIYIESTGNVFFNNTILQNNIAYMGGGGIFMKKINYAYFNSTQMINNMLTNTYPNYLNGGGALMIKECPIVILNLCDFKEN